MAAHEEMATEEIVQKILSKRPEVSREQIFEMLCAERSRTGGWIVDETLLRLIAARYGVEISRAEIPSQKFSISLLVPNLGDVTLMGRVIAVFPPRTFNGAKPGKFASFMISDDTAIVRVILWNDKADLVQSGEMKAGQLVRLLHGYTREDRAGKAELHLGNRSQVEINPRDASGEDYPSLSWFATKIKEISRPQQSIILSGKVKEVSASSAFMRRDQTTGKVLRFTLSDETGALPVVVWNEKAEQLEAVLKKDAQIHLVNAKVKAATGGLEVHVDSATYAEAH